MEDNRQKYLAKQKRVQDAVELKEPDRIAITPPAELFPVFNAGYTVAEVVYDTTLEKSRKAAIKYLNDFDPDVGTGVGMIVAGEGPVNEIIGPKNLRWAGMPGDIIDKNSLQQHIEFPTLLDDEFEEFFSDRTGWALRRVSARVAKVLEPLSRLNIDPEMMSASQIAAAFSTPEFKDMIQKFWKISEYYEAYHKASAAIDAEVEAMGYPINMGGMAAVPFDMYSDGLRGTLLSLSDLYDNTAYVERYLGEALEKQLAMLDATKDVNKGKHVFMALHKGMDGFMSDEHYEKYYWRDLQKIIEKIIEIGKVPYIYTEGKYNSRLKYLKEVPAGKVIYHFEEVDMAAAKRELGGVACISGGFPVQLLDWSTPDRVEAECKRLIDICAPGGGFIFETSCGLGNCKRENVETMFDTVKTYGKR